MDFQNQVKIQKAKPKTNGSRKSTGTNPKSQYSKTPETKTKNQHLEPSRRQHAKVIHWIKIQTKSSTSKHNQRPTISGNPLGRNPNPNKKSSKQNQRPIIYKEIHRVEIRIRIRKKATKTKNQQHLKAPLTETISPPAARGVVSRLLPRRGCHRTDPPSREG